MLFCEARMFWDCFEGDIQPDLSLCEDEDVFVFVTSVCVFVYSVLPESWNSWKIWIFQES